MFSSDALRDLPSLHGRAVTLRPLGVEVLEEYLRGLRDTEVRRLTGSHETPTRAMVADWLRTRHHLHDRADWAIVRASDGQFLGEAVINDVDRGNGTANYRVWLAGSEVFGHGLGTEVTQLVIGYAFDAIGLHRLELEVHAHNPRARRVYEKCGFVLEGRRRQALLWNGERHDTDIMAIVRTDARLSG